MGRIRTIKPEFPQSESIGRLSRDARLLFIQLWTIVDDEGKARAASRILASLLYPYDSDAIDHIDTWIEELELQGCAKRYQIEGNTYIQILNWLSHQKIDKPSKSKLPTFAEPSRGFEKGSVVSGPVLEGNGEDGKGDSHVIPPEMIARGVLSELALSGRDLVIVLEEVCKASLPQWPSPGDLRDALIKAHRDYEAAKPRLSYTKGAAKFFGDGDWRNPSGWPWKEGQQPAATTRRYVA